MKFGRRKRDEVEVAEAVVDDVEVAAGDRIAQLIVMPVQQARFLPVTELPESGRGEGGFGSTGYETRGTE